MKKLLSLALLSLSLAASAATIQSFVDFKSGDALKLKYYGEVSAVECFSTNATGTVAIDRVFERPIYTNAVEVAWSTNWTYDVAYSNTASHAVWTNSFPNLSFENDPYIVGVVTNELTSARTNRWPVLKETLVVTNSIISGACAGRFYRGEPDSGICVAPGDRLLFTGTATGGALRIVVE